MSKAKMLTVGAVCIAMAFMLNQISLFRMPMGGSITPASMLFVALAGYWLGPVYGIISGVSMGLLNSATGAVVVHPLQYLFDYVLGFGVLGFAAFFRKWNYGLQIGYVFGVVMRFFMVFLSGFIFFYMYAPEGQHAAIYSAVYNFSYIAPEMFVTLILISLPSMKHAINIVTKSVVTPEIYVEMAKNKGDFSPRARVVTGVVVGAVGGFAFVVQSYIQRLETILIYNATTDVTLLQDAPSRVYRVLERNTGQIFALQTVGVILFAISAFLILSVLINQKEKE